MTIMVLAMASSAAAGGVSRGTFKGKEICAGELKPTKVKGSAQLKTEAEGLYVFRDLLLVEREGERWFLPTLQVGSTRTKKGQQYHTGQVDEEPLGVFAFQRLEFVHNPAKGTFQGEFVQVADGCTISGNFKVE